MAVSLPRDFVNLYISVVVRRNWYRERDTSAKFQSSRMSRANQRMFIFARSFARTSCAKSRVSLSSRGERSKLRQRRRVPFVRQRRRDDSFCAANRSGPSGCNCEWKLGRNIEKIRKRDCIFRFREAVDSRRVVFCTKDELYTTIRCAPFRRTYNLFSLQ